MMTFIIRDELKHFFDYMFLLLLINVEQDRAAMLFVSNFKAKQ